MKFANLLKDTTTATSTASMTLAGAPEAKYRSLAKVIGLGKMAVGDTGICFKVEDTVGNWEEGFYTLTSATVLTRTSIIDSSNDGAAVTFGTGVKTVSNMIPGEWLSKILSTDDGIGLAALNTAGTLADANVTMVSQDSGATVVRTTLGALKAYCTNGTATAADTTAPGVPGSLSSSSVGQTVVTLSYTAATDNVGVTAYEVSRDGTTWTNNGTNLSYQFTGLTASTVYTLQVRAVDAAGNRSAAASLQVTTTAATGDTTAPSMAGSISTSSVTATGFTMTYSAGSDNVGVSRYEVSTDGGTSWINNGTNLSYSKTDAVASTLYNLRVRCFDAAGNVSNVLSATVTTSAAAAETLTIATPAAQTTGTAFTVSGTYANGTPTALDYSLDGGATWVQVASATIGSGAYSFSLTVSTTNATQTVSVRDRNVTSAAATSGQFAVSAPVSFHFDGNYGTFQSTAAYGSSSYASFSDALYIKDASNVGVDFTKYDVYFVMHNSSTVAPTTADALHATHSNTFNLCVNPGATPGLASANSIFVYKDTMPAGTYYMWAVVVNKGAGASATPVWKKAYDGANTGTPVPFTVS
jgi:hypothetical protein